MASRGCASPVLVMPSQSTHQPYFYASHLKRQSSPLGGCSPLGPGLALYKSYVSSAASERRGRKRSRDEASQNLDDRDDASAGQVYGIRSAWVTPPAPHKVGPSPFEPGSAVVDPISPVLPPERPALRSHKSQRLDTGSFASNSAMSASNPRSSSADSVVTDNFAHVFGVGWQLMGTDYAMSAAVRGWARYIENHYPINGVKLRGESKSLQSYLVEANEGWFLFAENLRQGRLVSKDEQRCINNLKATPPVFDGSEIMTPLYSGRNLTASTPADDAQDMEDTVMN